MKWHDPKYMESKAAVVRMAKRFEKQAIEEGFVGLKLDIFENCGWHFCLRGEYIQFWPSYNDTINALAGSKCGGRGTWEHPKNCNTFQEAWRVAVKECNKEIAELQDIMGSFMKNIR